MRDTSASGFLPHGFRLRTDKMIDILMTSMPPAHQRMPHAKELMRLRLSPENPPITVYKRNDPAAVR